ncbi:Transmembrane protein 26 [Papilio machaon]|uniref:Transmembrane protein 26 n=1 Tax=Papilio machaon TaxID=76193 RepID=A0A0N1IFQ7_PAPMA|nr:Transmembrane protein 26 [Papilio machaon]
MANVGKVLATIKAVITRLVFACHGIIAIWQVTVFKNSIEYWYLASPILLLIFEGVFTLTIKDNQEWKWNRMLLMGILSQHFSAAPYLESFINLSKSTLIKTLHWLSFCYIPEALTTGIPLPGATKIPTDMWVTLIEQFLMLTLIVGRWLLPKGDLTRDQLSQLLLVYIGTAADIIEFFDSFKDEKVATEKVLVLLTLAIWSWSLVQFTVVLTATKSRKTRGTAHRSDMNSSRACCCSIEVCAIIMNIALQDAPFLAFRLLIIAHYKIINYMNIFFTCKNTLVILLQIYRLYVLHLETVEEGNGSVYRKRRKHKTERKEHNKKRTHSKPRKHKKRHEIGETSVSVISDPRRQERVDGGRIRAIILTNTDEIKELELTNLFKDQVGIENEKKKGKKKKQKANSSEESLNNIHHTTDDSGI